LITSATIGNPTSFGARPATLHVAMFSRSVGLLVSMVDSEIGIDGRSVSILIYKGFLKYQRATSRWGRGEHYRGEDNCC